MTALRHHDNRLRPTTLKGFTLAESVLSLLIVATMLVAALNMVGSAARTQQILVSRTKGTAVAQELMTEILQARYKEPVDMAVVESAEDTLCSCVANTGLSESTVSSSLWWGEYFKPALPADAISWNVTKVIIHARKAGLTNGQTRAQLRPATAQNTPSNVVLEEAIVEESTLPVPPDYYTWKSIPFTSVTNLSPAQGLCLVLTTLDENPSMELRYFTGPVTNMPDTAMLQSTNVGASWDVYTDKALRFMIYGTVTTPDVNPIYTGPELPESSSSRADWDDVDDYEGWSASPPQLKDGTPIADYSGWTREVAVAYVDPLDPNGLSASEDLGLKRIIVRATDPQGRKTALFALRSQ